MAAVEQIKHEYPVRLLLEGKTKSAKKPVGAHNARRITVMNSLSIGSRESLNYVKNIDSLMAQRD